MSVVALGVWVLQGDISSLDDVGGGSCSMYMHDVSVTNRDISWMIQTQKR